MRAEDISALRAAATRFGDAAACEFPLTGSMHMALAALLDEVALGVERRGVAARWTPVERQARVVAELAFRELPGFGEDRG